MPVNDGSGLAPEARNRPLGAANSQASGPSLSEVAKYPGAAPTDFIWDPSTNTWAFNGRARPGQTYIPPPGANGYPDNGTTPTKSGQTGWVPSSDVKDPNGLFSGWTPAQWKSLAAFGAGAAVPIPAFGGAGGASGAAGAAVPEIGTTTGLAGTGLGGFGAAGVGAGAGVAGTGTAATIGAGGIPSIPTTAGWAGSGFGGAAASSTPAWLSALQNYGKTAGTVANVIGNAQTGANNARIAQGGLNNSANNSLVNLYQAQNNAQNQQAQTDLERQQFATKNRSDVMRQALVGSLLGSGSYQPTHVSPTGSSGGILNSLNANPGALQALRTFGQQGSTAQNTPLTFSGGQSVPVPSLAQTPQIDVNGTGSKISQALSIIGAIMAGK